MINEAGKPAYGRAARVPNMDVADWLRQLGLERYEPTFRENRVDADLLPKLTADDLKDLGVNLVGDRRRLLEAVRCCAAATTLNRPHRLFRNYG